MKRKGITPIIAIIVLLLITVALAGAAWTYLSTYMTGLTGQSFEVRDYFCIRGDTAVVIVANTGTATLPVSEISIIDTDTGTDVTDDGSWTSASGDTLPNGALGENDVGKWEGEDAVCGSDGCSYRVVGGTARAQIARIYC